LKSWPKVDANKPKPCPEIWTKGFGKFVATKELKSRKKDKDKDKAEVENQSQAKAWWRLKIKTKSEKDRYPTMPEYPVDGWSHEVFEYLQWKVQQREIGEQESPEKGYRGW
jgi:hypothetical protein